MSNEPTVKGAWPLARRTPDGGIEFAVIGAGGERYAPDARLEALWCAGQRQQEARYWQRIHHNDPRALDMADRHYSRKSPGTPEFVAAGEKVVLMHFAPDGTPAALWASHRPAPAANLAQPRFDGLDVWDCSIFRIEQRTVHASDLIREAVAITRGVWPELPRDGFYTTIDPRKVPPIKRRGRDTWGYSYSKAGWQEQAARTKSRKLLVFILPPDVLAAVAPVHAALCLPPFGIAWRRWAKRSNDAQLDLFAQEAA